MTSIPSFINGKPRVFAYNSDSYPKGCPVHNLWELTEPKWKGKVIIRDPALTPANLAFFATIASNPEVMAKAYKDLYGKTLVVKEKNAGWEFLRRLFENGLLTMNSDGDIGDAVGAAGQKDAPIGMITLTKMRDNQVKNLKLATCQGLSPLHGLRPPDLRPRRQEQPPSQCRQALHPLSVHARGHSPLDCRRYGRLLLEFLGLRQPGRTRVPGRPGFPSSSGSRTRTP